MEKGGSPLIISITVQPTLQISENLVFSLYLITSGAIQFGVPLIVVVFSKSSFIIFAPPKSLNLQHFIYSCLKINPWERLNVCQLLTHPFIIGDLNYSNFSDFHSKNSADTDILSRSKNGEKNNKQLNNRNFDKTENDIFGYKK